MLSQMSIELSSVPPGATLAPAFGPRRASGIIGQELLLGSFRDVSLESGRDGVGFRDGSSSEGHPREAESRPLTPSTRSLADWLASTLADSCAERLADSPADSLASPPTDFCGRTACSCTACGCLVHGCTAHGRPICGDIAHVGTADDAPVLSQASLFLRLIARLDRSITLATAPSPPPLLTPLPTSLPTYVTAWSMAAWSMLAQPVAAWSVAALPVLDSATGLARW